MYLLKFEEEVNSELLDAAKVFYDEGLVLRVQQTYNDIYTVWMADSLKVRTVNLTIGDFYDVFYNHCDCTHDREYSCEHQIVALFAVEDYFKYHHLLWDYNSHKEKLEEKLIDIPKRVLVDRLLEIIKKDPSITKTLFSEKSKTEDNHSSSSSLKCNF